MSYQLNTKDVLITQLEEDGVAFNSQTNEYFSLNETSFKILKGVEQNLSVEEICAQLQNLYDISQTDCTNDVNNTLQLFLEKKLILKQ